MFSRTEEFPSPKERHIEQKDSEFADYFSVCVPHGGVNIDDVGIITSYHYTGTGTLFISAKLMSKRSAIILGASGSVGQALLAEIVRSGAFNPIVVMTRRPLDLPTGINVEQRLVPDMQPDKLAQAVVDTLRDYDGEAVGFSVLGVGAGTAKLSLEEHRAVDVELNAAFARGLKASGKVRHLAFMSAIGANINAKTTGSGAAGMPRYARVKAESEEAVKNQGPAVVSIFRPAMIIGSQHTPWILSVLLQLFKLVTPMQLRSIRTTEIAQAMVAAALQSPTTSSVYTFPAMMRLIKRT
jgi:uncharacterized protein YbjT (DUF2867 family)